VAGAQHVPFRSLSSEYSDRLLDGNLQLGHRAAGTGRTEAEMTTSYTIGGALGKATEEGVGVPTGWAGGRNLAARLRDVAERLVPFSEERLLLRRAASTIERLERETERLGADLARMTAAPAGQRGARTP